MRVRLFDETRPWEGWADWFGIPRLTLMAVLGAVIARGQHHNEVFKILRPGIDLEVEIEARADQGLQPGFHLDDLYPDALPTLKSLKDEGYVVGVVGNQPSDFTSCLSEAGLELDLLSPRQTFGVEKPDVRFFSRIAEELRLSPNEVAYVGDRIDNDVGPAAETGMVAVFLRRGPWAYIQEPRPVHAQHSIDSLGELPHLLRRL
jgi:HAD superfamily hydrolase (TIGR01549 family)